MIDEALLRPGRMEIQMEISLPDELGRVQILNIHTAKMREQKSMAPDVDIAELATLTKNFSGAEIEGLVRAAQSSAMNRLVKVGQKVSLINFKLYGILRRWFHQYYIQMSVSQHFLLFWRRT